ncbi:MAG: hypothetical protein ABSA23_03235 [Anaerolineales bacterium]
MRRPRIKLAGQYALQKCMVIWQSAREMKTEKPCQSGLAAHSSTNNVEECI